jgi:hypothetical protein
MVGKPQGSCLTEGNEDHHGLGLGRTTPFLPSLSSVKISSVPSVLVVSRIRGIRAIRGFPDLTLQRFNDSTRGKNFPRNLEPDLGQYLCERKNKPTKN